jgi:hypothetical protein
MNTEFDVGINYILEECYVCINCGNKIDDANFYPKCSVSNVGTVPDGVREETCKRFHI